MKIRKFQDVMKSLYAENDYPSDRLIREHATLAGFTREFNARVTAGFSPEEVAAELERIRKDKDHTGGLPRLGRSHHGPRFRAEDN